MHCISKLWILYIYLHTLFQAIRRLSKDNVNLIKRSCDILNEVFTDAEGIQMMDKLEIFKQEQEKWDHLLHNDGIFFFYCFNSSFEFTDYEQV